MGSRLEKLCRPVLLLVCETRRRAAAGAAPSMESFQHELELRFDAIRLTLAADDILAREYARIEKPLLFFIDYMVKEGNLPFSAEWPLLARRYKELSGDEKFFELLAETIDDPESDNRLEEFFFMMGLGFDGVHRGDPGYIEHRMRLCAARFAHNFNPVSEPVTPYPAENTKPGRPRKHSAGAALWILLCCFVFALGCLIYNYAALRKATLEYRSTLNSAVYATSISTDSEKTADSRDQSAAGERK